MRALLISMGIVGAAIIAIVLLYNVQKEERLDQPIDIKGADPSDIVKFKARFIELCREAMEDAARARGISLDGDRPEKIKFTCGCVLAEATPRIEGMTPRQLKETDRASALGKEFQQIGRRCAASVGLK